MTVVDFRSGGFGGARDGYRDDDHDGWRDDSRGDAAYARYGYVDDDAEDWRAEDEWSGRYAAADTGLRLSEQDSLAGRVARLGHYLGAVISVSLMVGLMVWGYQLVMRDVSGVPVIRAVEGEARTAPENPGGELSARTGLAVNAVAAGDKAGVPDRVAIAPAATPLEAQDVPMGALGATARAPVSAEEQAVPDSQPKVVAALTNAQIAARAAEEQRAAEEAARAAAEVEASARATVTAQATVEGPANEAITDENGNPADDTAITAALIEAGAGNPALLSGSARPAPRPMQMAMAAPAPEAVAAPASAAAEPDRDPVAAAMADAPAADNTAPTPAEAPAPASAKVASGAPLVQIGAFDSDAIAQSEWNRISGRYGDLFAGKAPVVVAHQAGGRTFWRLRVAGFDNRDDARKFCAALAKAGTDCIPATAK